jgi:hypothetical protein
MQQQEQIMDLMAKMQIPFGIGCEASLECQWPCVMGCQCSGRMPTA